MAARNWAPDGVRADSLAVRRIRLEQILISLNPDENDKRMKAG